MERKEKKLETQESQKAQEIGKIGLETTGAFSEERQNNKKEATWRGDLNLDEALFLKLETVLSFR